MELMGPKLWMVGLLALKLPFRIDASEGPSRVDMKRVRV